MYLCTQIQNICFMIQLRVKEIAANCGLSLKDGCEKAGYKSLPSFYRQINNPESINMKTLIRIAETLDVPVYELFVDVEDLVMTANTPTPNTLICPKCGARLKVMADEETKEGTKK